MSKVKKSFYTKCKQRLRDFGKRIVRSICPPPGSVVILFMVLSFGMVGCSPSFHTNVKRYYHPQPSHYTPRYRNIHRHGRWSRRPTVILPRRRRFHLQPYPEARIIRKGQRPDLIIIRKR